MYSLNRLLPLLPDVPIIVVDDDSPDGTADIVRAHSLRDDKISLIIRKQDRGLSPSVRAGAEAASTNYILVMDSDGQHSPDDARSLLAAFDGQELVIGSRFLDESTRPGLSMLREIASRILNGYTNKSLIHPCSDPMTGFFIARRWDILGTKTVGFKLLREILNFPQDMRITEVPITFGVRYGGESKTGVKELINILTGR